MSANINPPLPDRVMIGDHSCRIWYPSKNRKCKRCGGISHRTTDINKCDYYTPSSDDVYVFNSGPLSNFHKCEVNLGPLTFPTSEHAYQFRACEEHLNPEVAEQVLKARSPQEAKSIANYVKDPDPTSHWNTIKCDVMRHVLRAKAESNDEFRQHLLNTGNQLLVEASASDSYWGSGLTYLLTTTTLSEMLPGKNMLGRLLVELRDELRNSTAATVIEATQLSSSSVTVSLDAPLSPDPVNLQQSSTPSTLVVTPSSTSPVVSSIQPQPGPTASGSVSENPSGPDSVSSDGMGNASTLSSSAVRHTARAIRKCDARQRASSIPAKFSQSTGTPLIRDFLKQDPKRKRVNSPTNCDLPGQQTDCDAPTPTSIHSSQDISDQQLPTRTAR